MTDFNLAGGFAALLGQILLGVTTLSPSSRYAWEGLLSFDLLE